MATGLHLGLRQPGLVPDRGTRADMIRLAGLAVPVMAYNALGAAAVSGLVGPAVPAAGALLVTALIAGAGAVGYALVVAAVSATSAVRLRLDPDTYGIPLVTSTVDLVGATLLISTAVLLGVVG